MSLTAVVTNFNYGRYLERCLDSALEFCDNVFVADDGSTDDSRAIIKRYMDKSERVDAVFNGASSGDPVWGSNFGIDECQTSHLIFLDADNWLTRRPPETDYDYLYADIDVAHDDGTVYKRWEFTDSPRTARDALNRFLDGGSMPFPWGGVWKSSFVRPLRWRRFDSTGFAADYRTAIDWLFSCPSMAYDPNAFLVFRKHEGQWSLSPEKALCDAEAANVRHSLRKLLR